MLNVVTMKWGDKFPPMYYNILERVLFLRWLKVEHRFICITDNYDGLSDNIETIPIQSEEMYPEHWTYMNMFMPQPYGIEGKMLILDVGIVIVDDITAMVFMEEDFICGRDWFRPEQEYDGNVLLIDEYSKSANKVWTKFKENPELIMNKYKNLQPFLYNELPGQPTWPEGWIVSYKHTASTAERRMGRVPPEARVICFHGSPLPHQVIKGKVGIHGPDPWIAKYWGEDL